MMSCGVSGFTDDSGSVERALEQMSPDHPRLFLPSGEKREAWRRHLRFDPRMVEVAAQVESGALAMLDYEPVAREMKGRRMLDSSRLALKRILTLTVAHAQSGNERFAERAIEEMLAAAAFSDWNPSHFLDTAEMTAALAVGYDGLYHEMSPEQQKTVRTAIIEKGLRPGFAKDHWWVGYANNWNQVCNGGLSLGALAVYEHAPELAARTIRRAVENIPAAMETYAPDGAYPEGPMYWEYGTTYNVLFLSALEQALGTDFGLSGEPGFLESSDYYNWMQGPTGAFFNYSDSGLEPPLAPALYWFAKRRDRPEVLWASQDALSKFLEKTYWHYGPADRFYPMTLLWMDPDLEPERPEQSHWVGEGINPVAVHRTGWDPRSTFVAVKAGTPFASHGHMDVGSFVIEMAGHRWAVDPGRQSYLPLEQKGVELWDGSQEGGRWTVFRLNNFSHNTLVVNGELQRVAGRGEILESKGPPESRTVMDLSGVYEGQLKSARRTVGLRGEGHVFVRDELTAPDEASAEARWGMATFAQVERTDEGAVILTQNDARVEVRVLEPEGARLEVLNLEEPVNPWDDPNPGMRLLAVTLNLNAGETEELRVEVRDVSSPGE